MSRNNNNGASSSIVTRQGSFTMSNTIRRVAELEATQRQVEQHNGFSRVTRSQARKLEQWNHVQTRSQTRSAANTERKSYTKYF